MLSLDDLKINNQFPLFEISEIFCFVIIGYSNKVKIFSPYLFAGSLA